MQKIILNILKNKKGDPKALTLFGTLSYGYVYII